MERFHSTTMRNSLAILVAVALFAVVSYAGNQKGTSGPEVIYPMNFTVSPPVRDMPPSAHHAGELKEEKPLRHPHVRSTSGNLVDPVVQSSTPTAAAATSLSQWEGLGEGYPNFTIVGVPPDPNMAVGPNHIVQWVNGGFAVFDKQGHSLYAVDDSTFWGNSTCNQLGGYSDPVVQYDKIADRWVVGEVAIPAWPGLLGVFAQCFAVSTTSDPAGSYYMWAYSFGTNVNDYPKIGMWPDAYYITWNIFDYSSGNFLYPEACAWDRSAAVNGVASPGLVCFKPSNAYASFLPSDWDGSASPPAGSPNFLMDVDTTAGTLHLWKFHVDFANPSSSTFTGPASLSGVGAFNAPCPTTQNCIPQPGTTQKLDALADRLMYRLAYRNFGDHESLVANHSVTTTDATYGSRVGVRWYEIRDPNGSPTIYQQGTFAPDSDNRWMASIAQDQSGDIAVGYSVSSAATYPSIRYTGRATADQTGTLQAETTMVPGGGYQSSYNRWGDYSAMRIDPTDDCTFWYTTEYQATTQPGNWYTRIGSFKFDSCGGGGTTLTPTSTTLASSPNPSTVGQTVTLTATVNSSGATGSVTFYDGANSLGTISLSGGVASLPVSTLSVGTHTLTATYSGDGTYAGSSSSPVSQVVQSAPKTNTTTTLSSSPNPAGRRQTVTFTATVSPSGATGTVQFLDGSSVIGSGTLSGGKASFATSKLSPGTHSMTAHYLGDNNYNASTSAPLTQTVNRK